MSEDTWTLAELSRITGLDYETVKFYARPVNAKTKGGGVIHETKTVNGRRLFDAEALFDLYASGLLKSTGASLESIREANKNCDYASLLDQQLGEIQRKKIELEWQENKLNAIRGLMNALGKDADVMELRSAFAPIMRDRILEYAQVVFNEFDLRIDAKELAMTAAAVSAKAIPSNSPVKELNAVSSFFFSGEFDEVSLSRIEELLNGEKLRRFTDSFTGLLEMATAWHPGIKPTDPIFAKPIKEALSSIEHYFGPVGRQWLPKAYEHLFLTDLIGVSLELGCGKGVTACLHEAMEYWSNHDE